MAEHYSVASRFDWPIILLRSSWQMLGESQMRRSLLSSGSSGVDSDFSGGAGSFEAATTLLACAAESMGLPHSLTPRSVCESPSKSG